MKNRVTKSHNEKVNCVNIFYFEEYVPDSEA